MRGGIDSKFFKTFDFGGWYLYELIFYNNHTYQDYSYSSMMLWGQLEKSSYPSGSMGVSSADPKAFNLSERSPVRASWASSARDSSPQSLKMFSCSYWAPKNKAALKASTWLLFLLASFMIFSILGLLCWREYRKLSRSYCLSLLLAIS